MTNAEKLIKKIKENPVRKDITFKEMEKFMGLYGYSSRNGNKTSHHIFTKDGCRPINIPAHDSGTNIKPAYIKQAIKTMEEDNDDWSKRL